MSSIRESKKPVHLLFFFIVVASIATLTWILNYSRYGIDFTDESLYLIWAANPFQYDASVSQFGFVHHPLYVLLNGNIAHLRQANILFTFGLAFVLSNAVLAGTSASAMTPASRVIASLGFATASLTLFSTWLVTPNYNSLNLQALLITATGVAWSSRSSSRAQLAGLLFIGIGGWLSFMAKPSTALALGILVVLYWAASGKLRPKNLLLPIAVACALLLLSAWTIDGSIAEFRGRISMGLEIGRIMGGGHSIEELVRLDDFSLTRIEKILFFIAAILPCACAVILAAEKTSYKLLGIIVAILPFTLILLATSDISSVSIGLGTHQGLLHFSIFTAAMVYVVAALAKRHTIQLSRDHLLLALFLLLLPYCYAFGTNGNYWWAGAFAGVFWALPGLILVNSIRGRRDPSSMIAMLALTTQALSVLMLQTGMQAPYRQPQALNVNDQQVEVGQPGSTLLLSTPYAEYLDAAKDSAKAAGFSPGAPMIDLSGQSPGILYALQAESLGQAWMIGGYPGSADLAAFVLKSVSCEKLAAAWVLAERNGPRNLPITVLTTFGAEMTTDYEQVGSWETAAGAGGYAQPREQTLWKPIRNKSTAAAACSAARTGTAQ